MDSDLNYPGGASTSFTLAFAFDQEANGQALHFCYGVEDRDRETRWQSGAKAKHNSFEVCASSIACAKIIICYICLKSCVAWLARSRSKGVEPEDKPVRRVPGLAGRSPYR